MLHLMDQQYEQISVDKAIFGDHEKWLTEGVEVSLQLLQDGEAVTGNPPHIHALLFAKSNKAKMALAPHHQPKQKSGEVGGEVGSKVI